MTEFLQFNKWQTLCSKTSCNLVRFHADFTAKLNATSCNLVQLIVTFCNFCNFIWLYAMAKDARNWMSSRQQAINERKTMALLRARVQFSSAPSPGLSAPAHLTSATSDPNLFSPVLQSQFYSSSPTVLQFQFYSSSSTVPQFLPQRQLTPATECCKYSKLSFGCDRLL